MLSRALTLCALLGCAHAETLHIAVATNFAHAYDDLAADFSNATGHTLLASKGSTGKLYAQITQGAPFALFLAADQERPARLVAEGHAVADSQFTYAEGQLVMVPAAACNLSAAVDAARRIAIANPALAPYGRAAAETLEALGFPDVVTDKVVMGENVGQAFALFATANVDLALVARASALEAGIGSCAVPTNLHSPIRQDAVLVKDLASARAFLEYLRSERAQALIKQHGYLQ